MSKALFTSLLVLACWLCVRLDTLTATLGEDEARAILIEAENRHRNRSLEYTGEIIVVSRNGKERRKTWRSYREGDPGRGNRLIRFLAPPEVRGVGFLSLSRPGGTPDRWMYLPSMKRERRIATEEQGAAFVGTDFSYEDLQDLDHSRYDVSRLADQTIGGHLCHVIDLVPRERSSYVKKVVFIRKDDLTLARTDFFRKGDAAPSKHLELLDYERVEGKLVARKLVMADFRKGSQTTILLSDVEIDRPQPPDRFTIQNLLREGTEAPPVRRPDRPREARGLAAGLLKADRFADRERPESALGSNITGFAEAMVIAYTGTSSDRDARASGWATVFVKKQSNIGRARFFASLRAQGISSSERGALAFDPADRRVRRSPLALRELSVVVPLAPAIDVQAGRFELSWAGTDLYSPADAFLSRDLSDPFFGEKLPVWGARLQGERGPVRFELYTALVTTPWRLPRMDGRYSPFSAFNVYLLDPADSSPPRRGFETARLRHSGRHWDVGVWARTGVRPAPILVGSLDHAAEEPVGLFVPIEWRFAREHALGVQLSRDYREWILRGEAAVLRSRDASLGNAMLWSLEAERQVRSGALTFTVAGNALESPTERLLLFDRAYLPGFIAASTQTEPWGSWTISCLGTLQKVGGLLKGQVSRSLEDSLTLTVAAALPYGAQLGSPGAYFKARQARAALRWSW